MIVVVMMITVIVVIVIAVRPTGIRSRFRSST
jgi:hypothetical protein